MRHCHKFGHSAAAQNQKNTSPVRGFFFTTLPIDGNKLRGFR